MKPKHQSFRLASADKSSRTITRADWSEAFAWAVVQQVALLVVSALILDGGVILRRVVVAAMAFWALIALALVRRRVNRTKFDLYLVKYGIWLLAAIVSVVAMALGRY